MKQEVLKYKEILSESKETQEEEEIQYKVETAELSVRSVISETKKSLSQSRKALKRALKEEPFDYNEYSDIEEEVISLELGLEKAEKFLKDRF